MTMYKNISLDNIRKKRIKKKEKRRNTFGDVCWFFRSFRQLYVMLCKWQCLSTIYYKYIALFHAQYITKGELLKI